MTDEALDALAKQLLLDAARLEYRDIIQSDEQHTFSPSFERKMKKLVRRADHPVRHRITQTAACVALVVIIGGGSVLAVSAEARAAFFGWIREVYETYFVYHYEGAETIAPEDVVYRPTWLPEGYAESMVPELDGQVAVIYKNEEGNLMSFSYSTDPEIINLQVEGNKGSIERVFIGDLPGDLYIDADEDAQDVLVWMDDQNGIVYWISANLPAEDLIKMAESVTAFDAAELAQQSAVYVPAWLPDGYEMTVAPEPGVQVVAIYENTDGETAVFAYSNVDHNTTTALFLPAEGLIAQSVDMNGQTADLYMDNRENEPNCIVWTDEETRFVFYISGHLPAEDLIKMAESVELTQ